MKTGTILILIGSFNIFLKNNIWTHTTLQIIFITGCILFVYGASLAKKSKNSILVAALMILLALPGNVIAQDYSQQVKAFEQSFHQKDVTIIKPFLSDSLQFASLPVQNTMPILTNIVTKLFKLNTLHIQRSKKGKVKILYNFKQLGKSESYIHFDSNGKITKIEFVENLIREDMKHQKKMKSSVQAPKPDKISFDYSKTLVEFPSKDGLTISADLYEISPKKPVILLCHQAGYNKYEYADIAPRLNKMGYNALAIDQRSGGTFAGKQNETHNIAIESGIENIDYTDATQDIESAIEYLSEKYQQKIIVLGSSYSSSLILHIAEKNKHVKAVISFSPGDYFGENFPSLKTVFLKIKQPFLVTSSKDEANELKELFSATKPSYLQLQFIPKSDGFHGSKALWIDQKGADEYWAAITSFLSKIDQ